MDPNALVSNKRYWICIGIEAVQYHIEFVLKLAVRYRQVLFIKLPLQCFKQSTKLKCNQSNNENNNKAVNMI